MTAAALRSAPQLPDTYNPANSRLLVEASKNTVEIENAFGVHNNFVAALNRRARDRGMSLKDHKTNSLYIDTPRLSVYAAGKTLRLRPGAVSKCAVTSEEETFPNQFSMKMVHWEFQRAAQNVAGRLYGDQMMHLFYPKVRSELEGAHSWPKDAVQLRHQDLPNEVWDGHRKSIGETMRHWIRSGGIRGVSKPDNLLLIPYSLTVVERRRMTFYVEPGQSYDFRKVWPAIAPTDSMRESGNYLAMELALDRCTMFACPENHNVDALAHATGSDLGHRYRLGQRSLLEYEVKGKDCGPNLTDLGLVEGYVRFGFNLHAAASQIGGRGLLPSHSKGTTTLGMHPKCVEGGALRDIYVRARPYAP